MREKEEERSFVSEEQNSPADLKNCFFNPEEFYYIDDQYVSEEELVKTLGSRLIISAERRGI